MGQLTLIVPAAGESQRMGLAMPKPLLELDGKTIIQRCLEPFLRLDNLLQIVVLSPEKFTNRYSDLAFLKNPKIKIISGGSSRQESVYKGLQFLSQTLPDTKNISVAIHDAARCLLSPEKLQAVIEAGQLHKAAALAVPVVDSLKYAIDGKIINSVERKNLFAIQTPQVFDFDLIFSRHSYFANLGRYDFSDDTAMLEGVHEVRLIESDRSNIKITTAEDLKLAAALLKAGI